uniref:Uncharacterized protein n=1 Tax=Ditylenchus dipsaci TaxID=166011 RepID=A0A915D293_9BILA
MAFPTFRGRAPFSFTTQAPRAPFNSNQKFGFFSPQTQPVTRPPIRPVINLNVKKELPTAIPPQAGVPITTIFVGNIADSCSDELIQKILTQCGPINNWKRLQDANSKFKAFGFCDFDHPDGTLRALRMLCDFQLGDKKLTVKADEATAKTLSYTKKAAKIHLVMELEEENADLLPKSNGEKEAEGKTSRSSSHSSRDSAISESKARINADNNSRTHKRKRSTSRRRRSSASSRKSKRSRSAEVSPKKKRRHSSSSSSSSSASSVVSKHKSRHRSRRSSHDSEDSDDVKERRRLKQEIKRKEQSYLKRLEKWETRERRMAKQYAKDEESEIQRKKMISREAKKLKQFLEDYEDERDDNKYYKSSSLFQRRRNYERERQEDAKDRQDELQEIEELKKQILAENKNVADPDAEARKLHEAKGKQKMKCYRGHSGSPTPHIPLGQKFQSTATPSKEEEEASSSGNNSSSNPSPVESKAEEKTKPPGTWANISNDAESKETPGSNEVSDSKEVKKDGSKLVATIQKPSSSIAARVNGVFDNDDETRFNSTHQIKKKIKPFEITREDRIQAMTPEERKKLTKELIERIPTGKEELFDFTITWEFVDEALFEKRIKPWINKKICEYIGEEEPSLVTFICDKIASQTEPKKC